MADQAHDLAMRQAFALLLDDLSATWPEHDIAYVRNEVGYGEYGDALENLVALAVRRGMALNTLQADQVKSMAVDMGMETSRLMAELSLATSPPRATPQVAVRF